MDTVSSGKQIRVVSDGADITTLNMDITNPKFVESQNTTFVAATAISTKADNSLHSGSPGRNRQQPS